MGRPQLTSHWQEGDDLVAEARAAVVTLSDLLAHDTLLTAEGAAAIAAARSRVERRLERSELVVAVIGERGAGKATFLNALAGQRVLGLTAEDRPDTVTFLRQRDALDFRARLADGGEEEFSRDVPDRSDALRAELAPLEGSLVAADADRKSAEGAAAAASRALERGESALDAAQREVDAAHEEASRLEAEARDAGAEAERLDEITAQARSALPVVFRARPPAWAAWSWALRALLYLFVRRRTEAHEVSQKEHAGAVAQAKAARDATAAAVAELRAAEARAGKLRAPVESARDLVDRQAQQLGKTEGTLADLFTEATRVREELTRHQEERRREFFARLTAFSDRGARGNEVFELEIDAPAPLLPRDVVVVDVPGIGSDSAAAREHAWRVIREEADACIVLSEMQRGMTFGRKFCQLIREIVPHVVLVMTKMDKAFVEAIRKRQGEPWQLVEELRRAGTKSFARDIGRDAATLLSVAVSAESALKPGAPSGLAKRFAADIERMFELLRHEGAVMLGARGAEAVRTSLKDAQAAVEYGSRKLEARKAFIDTRRVPDPERFRGEQLDAAQRDVDRAASLATGSALEIFRDRVRLVRIHGHERLAACSSPAALRKEGARLDGIIRPVLEKAHADAGERVISLVVRAVQSIREHLLATLRARYGATTGLSAPPPPVVALPRLSAAPPPGSAQDARRRPKSLADAASSATTWLSVRRLALGALGAGLGAAVGVAVAPEVPLAQVAPLLGPVPVTVALPAALALVGTLAALFARTQRAKAACVDALEFALRTSEASFVERVQALRVQVAAAIRADVERATAAVVEHYGRVLVEPLEAEQASLEADRAKLAELELIQSRLREHETRLVALHKTALEQSSGLSR